LAQAIIASAMPVLPLVGSISLTPGLSSPRSSAPSIIDSAGRSFTLPPGLWPSILASSLTLGLEQNLSSSTRGVLPTRSAILIAW
jgi:hypothetical protein